MDICARYGQTIELLENVSKEMVNYTKRLADEINRLEYSRKHRAKNARGEVDVERVSRLQSQIEGLEAARLEAFDKKLEIEQAIALLKRGKIL